MRLALAALIEQVRSLKVDDGMIVHPVSSRPMRRLRVVSGSHPRPGTVYAATERLVDVNNDPAAPMTVGRWSFEPGVQKAARFREGLGSGLRESTWTIELRIDDQRQVEVVSTSARGDRSVVTIADPRRPSTMTYSSLTSGGSSWWTKGDVTSKFEIDLAALSTATRSDGAPLTGRAHHRRFIANGYVDVEDTDHGHRLRIGAVVRGRGLARPVLAVVGGLFGRILRRSMDETLAKWESDGMPLILALRQPGDPQQLATTWLADLLEPFADEAQR